MVEDAVCGEGVDVVVDELDGAPVGVREETVLVGGEGFGYLGG